MAQRAVGIVTGDREVVRDLLALDKGVDDAKDVVGEVAQRIARKAKVIAPVDDIDGGQLRDSIRATKPVRTKAGRISAGIVAGGPALAKLASERGHKEPGSYAVIQHEDLTLRHPNGGRAKFIEEPWLEEAPKVPGLVQERLDKKVGRG